MPRKAANGGGSVERRGALWWVQVSLPRAPGAKLRRKRVPIADSEKMSRGQAVREGAKIARDVREGRIVFDEKPSAARVAPSGPSSDWSTVRKLGAAWTSGEMFKRFGRVNKLRVKAGDGAKIDGWTLDAHVYEVKTRGPSGPAFGDLAVVDVKSDDVAIVMGAQPAEHRSETRTRQYSRLHRIFELAEFPCRLRSEGSNPVRKYLRPESDAEKLFCFLYPTELVALLGCKGIPLARRVLHAVATFTGQRKGSLFTLQWKHADFGHGTLASFKTKTGRAQYFVADRGLMALLEEWHKIQGEPEDDEAIVRVDAIDCEPRRLAETLRADLKLAGVTRSLLFEDKADNVEALRFHDLRSTFCTWARRAGKSDAWISERTGHDLDGKMIARYDRGAQTLADLDYEPFPNIADAVPELKDARLHRALHKRLETELAAVAETEGATGTSSARPGRFELPTTGSVDGTPGPSIPEEREITPPTGPHAPLATPQIDVSNAGATADAELRAKIAEAVIAGDDAEAARLMALLGKPKLRIVGSK